MFLEYETENYSPADYGWIHEDDMPDLEHCKNMIEGIIDVVYFSGDIDELERFIEDLASEFEVLFPISEPVLKKHGSLFSSFADYTMKYSKMIRS